MVLLKIIPKPAAAEQIKALKHLESDWIGAIRKTTLAVFELARQRFISQMIPGGGIMLKKRVAYQPVPGANVPKFILKRQKNEGGKRVYSKVLSGKMYFHNRKLVSRSGETLNLFERKIPGLIEDVKRSGNMTIGTFGVQGGGGYGMYQGKAVGTVEARIASHETGFSRGGFKKKPRRPMWLALQYGTKRFDTLMAMHLQNVEKTFNAKAA